MSWRPLTEDDIKLVLSGTELEAIRAAALAQDQPDPVPPTITLVTDLVRGRIAASGKYILGATGIPEKLIATALDILAYRIYGRINQDPGATRLRQYNDALAVLKDVASGGFGLEEPLVPSTENDSAPAPRITPKTRRFTDETQEGL